MSENILVIKHGALGDFCMSIGMMQAIRHKHPDAKLTLLTSAGMVKIAEQTGFFSEILIDNRPRYNLKKWYYVCKRILADKSFDFIYDLQSSRRTFRKYYPIARFLTGNKMSWGRLAKGGLDFYITPQKKKWSFQKPEKTFIPLQRETSDLSFCHGEGKYFHELPPRYVLLIPGCSANHPYKRWPAESYRRLSEELGKQGISSVVLGTNEEKEAVEIITKNNPYTVSFLNKSGLLDIPDLARKSFVVVGNDTGPVHMAALTGKPTIALFCAITQKSASTQPNAVNIIETDIADISVETVLKALTPYLG